MKRIIFDTNIYGIMIKEPILFKIRAQIKTHYTIYGIDIIRKELRDTPKNVTLLKRNLRISLLTLYDEFVDNHTMILDDKMDAIAKKYYNTYRELGGIRNFEQIINDFRIVACASLKEMDILVSNDKSTMLGELSIKSYKIVNDILNIRTPNFLDYEQFKRWSI